MPKTEIRIDDREVRQALIKSRNALRGGRRTFAEFAKYMGQVTASTFAALRHGGNYRGVHWDYFAPQYTRKTDGVTVPAWGGVPKLRGKGLVKGRKRRRGGRLREGDPLLDDTGQLKRKAGFRYREGLRMSETRLEMKPGVPYAAYQQAMRPFLFFEMPKDANQLLSLALKQLRREVKR